MKFYLLIFFMLWGGMSVEVYAEPCPSGKYFVQGHSRQAYYRNDGTHVSKAVISSYCKQYRSDGALKLKFNPNNPKRWPHKKEKFKKCTQKQKNQIQKALIDLPKILTNVGSLKLHCAKKSVYSNNPAASAPISKVIVLYNSAFTEDIKRYIAHELAHILYDRLSDFEKKSYRDASGWEVRNGQYRIKRKKFSAPDGASDPDEDFSNNVEYYLVENKEFKKRFPKISKWIKKLLGDKK